jgi:capsular polysaccharide export protein
MAGRKILLVTQPAGPFSRFLDRALRAGGAEVARVVMNGGELFDWLSDDTAWFKGPSDSFGPWIRRRLKRGYTDVVVFNDVNPYSQAALDAARALGLRTWILENGYQRPDWVTIETQGVNARSGLPRDPAAYDDAGDLPAPPDRPHIGLITPFHAFNTIQHYTLIVLFSPWMRGYRYPFTDSIHGQVFGHIQRYSEHLAKRHARERQADRVARQTPFFLLLLQREGDSQLMVHSDLKTNHALMQRVIADFAANAPAEARLVIKNHPLDPGLGRLEREAYAIAATHGVQHRLSFLEGGNFAALARASQGVVAVNSTAALAAVGFGVPVKLLGRAFFDLPGLIDQQPLESFWSAPAAPDHDLFTRFRRRLSVETQIYGSYHNPWHVAGTAQRIAERILG